ncbi:MAG: 50S ribosomal protein L28 [Chloroflexi bacterium]|nr:50S ribosomal protein L28 [Chloroflexota bacterium]MDA8187078.1 50S ribosomal protein L28 [Dehalococcoidales bacterium]
MAGKCEICGKVPGHGHNVSHSKRRTNRIWAPNIQKSTVTIGGVVRSVRACTRCLRTLQKATA